MGLPLAHLGVVGHFQRLAVNGQLQVLDYRRTWYFAPAFATANAYLSAISANPFLRLQQLKGSRGGIFSIRSISKHLIVGDFNAVFYYCICCSQSYSIIPTNTL